jgi:hypothetical protein
MVKKWDLLYDLRDDVERVRRVQKESARSSAPYLFGSEEWWAAIDADSIERRSVEGTITEAQPTSMADRPEFRMRTDDGSELSGFRHGDPTRYVEGLHIRFDYVTVQRSPEAQLDLNTTADVIIAVWIEHSHKRTPYLHSFYPSPPGPI